MRTKRWMATCVYYDATVKYSHDLPADFDLKDATRTLFRSSSRVGKGYPCSSIQSLSDALRELREESEK